MLRMAAETLLGFLSIAAALFLYPAIHGEMFLLRITYFRLKILLDD